MHKNGIYKPAYSKTKKERILRTQKSRDLRLPQNIWSLDIRNILRIIVLIAFDIVAIALGWHFTTINVSPILTSLFKSFDTQVNLLFPSILLLGICLLSTCQAYRRGIKSRNLFNSLKAITLTYLAFVPIIWELFGKEFLPQLFLAWLASIFLLNSFRLVIFQTLLKLRQEYFPLKIKVMLIGEREDIEKCLPLLENSREFQVGAQLDIAQFNNSELLVSAFERMNTKEIGEILICSWHKLKSDRKFFWKIRASGIYWRILKLDEGIKPDNLEISQFEGFTTLRISDPPIVGIDFLSKRVFDIIASLILLAFLGLPMLAIAAAIKLDSPGSIFYRQTRVGLNGNCFKVWKFRTMVENASQLQQQLEAKNEIDGGVLFKIKDDPRITKIGRYLRQYSLDELPQLFNVLCGEMSLVGPRPLPIRDVEKFSSPEQYFRHEVLPGITGLWQVSGRSDTDSDNVFNLDFEYIQNWSLGLDFQILLRTIGVVLNSKGAY